MSQLPATFVEGFHKKEDVIRMKYNTLGNTGLEVSIISLGGGAFSPFYDGLNEAEAIETIIEAIRLGVNYIDTAPWYGQGRSEAILGKALRNVPRQAYYIATKVGRYELEYDKMFDFSSDKIRSSMDDSLKALGLDYVDIIQVHDVEFSPSQTLILNETLPTLLDIKNKGKTKYIGITGYPLNVLYDILEKSSVKIDTVLTYCRNTLIDSALNDFMENFESRGVGIISAASHAMGLLTNNGPPSWHPASDEIKDTCKKAIQFCQHKDVDIARLALWFSMGNTNIATHLVGVNCRTLLHSNISVVLEGLTDDEKNCLKEIIDKYFSSLKLHNWEGIELKRYWYYFAESVKKNVTPI